LLSNTVRRETILQTAESRDEITQRVWGIVNRLPQREAIIEGDARAWVSAVVGAYGEMAIWHATRSGGFGGSQIGALVRNRNGQRADHGASAHDIVELCLLRRLPDEPSGQMQRGVFMESIHREFFFKKYGARRDAVGFETLAKSSGMRQWMRYSPDELAFVDAFGDQVAPAGKSFRVLGDYKAPTTVDQNERVSFQYVCQLHMGRLVCEHNGVHIDGLVLSQFDWANWQLKDDIISYLPQLDELIVDAGDHYWQFVLRGEVPPFVRKPKLDPESFAPELREAAERLAKLRALHSALESRIETITETIKPELEKHQFGGAALRMNGITFTASPVADEEAIRAKVPVELLETVPLVANRKRYDADAMLKALKAREVDVKQFLLPGNLNSDALYSVLLEAGYDADELMRERVTGRIDANLKSEANAWIERELASLVGTPPDDAADDAAGQPNDREGQETQRGVPRSVSA
jgi:hypothetical protein